MKRLFAAALLLALLAPTTAQGFTMAHRFHRCRFESVDGHAGYTQWEKRTLIACAVDHFQVPGGFGTVLAIAQRESGPYIDCHARNSHSSATGALQIVRGTWDRWYHTFSPSLHHWGWGIGYDRAQCRANVIIGVRAMHRYGLGAWS